MIRPGARGAVEAVMMRIRPGTVNAAVMQFGQRICLPRSPRCGECPVARGCRGRRLGIAERIPARRRQEVTQKNTDIAVLMRRDQRVWLEKRKEGIGRGLWAFPALGEVRGIENWRAAAELPGRVHLYTRYRDELRPRLYEPLLPEGRLKDTKEVRSPEGRLKDTRPTENGAWHTMDELARAAMPSVHRKIAGDAVNLALRRRDK